MGVTQVTWSNDRGGSGTASGTTSWSVSGIVLQSGDNVITVTARDAANNSGTDILTVTYTPSSLLQTLMPEADATLLGATSEQNKNSGSLNTIVARNSTNPWHRRSILRFDLGCY